MSAFLLELLSEEIPARMQPEAARQLHRKFAELLAAHGLAATKIAADATPRRLFLVAEGLPAEGARTVEERRGPRVDAPEKAIAGFLRSTGLSRAQLEERDTGKGVFLFARIAHGGERTADILAAQLPALLQNFSWPKSQRWGAASISTASPRWVRPLRAIVALLDDAVVPFEALGVQSGRLSFGHRFLHGRAPFPIADVASWRAALVAAHVLPETDARRARIRDGALALADGAGLKLRADPALLDENAGLTEWPVPVLGRFDPAYLAVPPEIIRLTMATNQKYFALEDGDGKLAPAFVAVANLAAPDGGRAIIHGNERVLSARLADARFFFEQDRKTSLDAFAQRLSGIVFHEKLGTMADKVARVARLARFLAERHFPHVDPAGAERAARLMKADLLTGTVGEFPELQGVIGGYLAAAEGEGAAIVAAIRQQYRPCPEGDLPVVVALADRIDTLASFFAVGIRPTGSRDPFALRRAAQGIVDMLLDGGRRIPLRPLLREAGAADPAELIEFLKDRLKVRQLEAGVAHDVAEAIHALPDEDDLVRLSRRLAALGNFLATDEGADLLAGFRRAANILKAEERKDGGAIEAVLPELAGERDPAELALWRFFVAGDTPSLPQEIERLLQSEDFEGAMHRLSALREPVDRFFDEVTVNAADPAIRQRRLRLLAVLRRAMLQLADFSRIEG